LQPSIWFSFKYAMEIKEGIQPDEEIQLPPKQGNDANADNEEIKVEAEEEDKPNLDDLEQTD
jgi:hypothetical protein